MILQFAKSSEDRISMYFPGGSKRQNKQNKQNENKQQNKQNEEKEKAK